MKQVTLNKNSWHYKIYDYFVGGEPKSLCPYFWTLVALFIFSPFILLVFGFAFLMEKYAKKIGKAILWPFRPLVKFFRIVGIMIVSLYKRACPLINWKE